MTTKTFRTIRYDYTDSGSIWEVQAWSEDRKLWIIQRTFARDIDYSRWLFDNGVKPVSFEISIGA